MEPLSLVVGALLTALVLFMLLLGLAPRRRGSQPSIPANLYPPPYAGHRGVRHRPDDPPPIAWHPAMPGESLHC